MENFDVDLALRLALDSKKAEESDSMVLYVSNLGVGDTCLSVNKKREGRRWICLSCVDAILRYKETKAQMNCVPFGDEGAYLALCDFAAEQEAELYDRGILN